MLEATYQALLTVKTTYDDLIREKNELVGRLENLNSINEQYLAALAVLANPDSTEEERAEANAQLAEIDRASEKRVWLWRSPLPTLPWSASTARSTT